MKKWDLWMKWNPAFTVETSPDHLVRCELSQVTGTTNTNITPTPLLSLSPSQDLKTYLNSDGFAQQREWQSSTHSHSDISSPEWRQVVEGLTCDPRGSSMFTTELSQPTSLWCSLVCTPPVPSTVQSSVLYTRVSCTNLRMLHHN